MIETVDYAPGKVFEPAKLLVFHVKREGAPPALETSEIAGVVADFTQRRGAAVALALRAPSAAKVGATSVWGRRRSAGFPRHTA